MDVLTLTLPPSLRSKLLAAGFHTTAAFAVLTPFHLAHEAHITIEGARVVLKLVPRASRDHIGIGGSLAGIHRSLFSATATARDLLIREKGRRRIGTDSVEVDKIFGGGNLSKELTDICQCLHFYEESSENVINDIILNVISSY